MQVSKKSFEFILTVSILSLVLTVGLYAYLGTFSRYYADDYCEAVRIASSSSPFNAVFERYTSDNWPRATMRYSNLLFVGFSEMLGTNAMQITTSMLALLWGASLILAFREVRSVFIKNWPIQRDLFFGGLIAFFSYLQAPNLFQSVYWRSAMMTHFAPLVFGMFLFVFLVRQLRTIEEKPLSWITCLFVFVSTFIVAGFSEPPTTSMITVLVLIIIFFLLSTTNTLLRRKKLILLGCTFMGALVGFFTMLLSPATTGVLSEQPEILHVFINSFLYSYLFLLDSIKTQPFPSFLLLSIPFLLFFLIAKEHTYFLQKPKMWLIIIFTPFLLWLLIAAGFAPSVYGQGFPPERMLFLARTLIIIFLIFEGILFGLLLQQIQAEVEYAIIRPIALSLFIIATIVYPLRATFYLYKYTVPEYQERAKLWDLRDAFIRRHALQGETNLVTPGFSGIYGIKELDDNPNHWINICVARYYGVDSIRTIGVEGDNLIEVLSE